MVGVLRSCAEGIEGILADTFRVSSKQRDIFLVVDFFIFKTTYFYKFSLFATFNSDPVDFGFSF